MLLVVDHHDSFTWNLVHALARALEPDRQVSEPRSLRRGEPGARGVSEVLVRQSDTLTVAEVRALAPRGIVLSPGPGHPDAARSSQAVVRELAGMVPMLGVCLGHQLVCAVFGARVSQAPSIYHGRTSWVHHDGKGLFEGLPSPFRAARYHSLSVEPETLPADLEPCAFADSGELMAVRHRTLPLWSLQFHPESFLTDHGQALVQAFVATLPVDSPWGAQAGSLGIP